MKDILKFIFLNSMFWVHLFLVTIYITEAWFKIGFSEDKINVTVLSALFILITVLLLLEKYENKRLKERIQLG